jgi:hypothetical protein
MLPFVAICAASAPLLGLLGTVTGIISTFKLITVFGSGDVKTLSSGISQALITTEFGLIVAIPSLLLHAFLSRKARGVVNQMETAAVAFANQISRTPYENTFMSMQVEAAAPAEARQPAATSRTAPAGVDNETIREQFKEVLMDLLQPQGKGGGSGLKGGGKDPAPSVPPSGS